MSRVVPATLLWLAALASAATWAQQASSEKVGSQRFDVASVKRNYLPDLIQRSGMGSIPGRFTATNVTLRSLTMHAFDLVLDYQLTGGPSWIGDTKYNVEVTAPGGATSDEKRLMLRRLLADRFGLVIRKETRANAPIYRLVLAKDNGKLPKGLTASSCPESTDKEPPPCNTVAGGPGTLMGVNVTMPRLARLLTSFPYTEVGRIVVDATGLTGSYQFVLQFSPTRQYYGLRSEPDPNLPTFMTALQEQAGLKLQPATGPVDVWIIQSAKYPESD